MNARLYPILLAAALVAACTQKPESQAPGTEPAPAATTAAPAAGNAPAEATPEAALPVPEGEEAPTQSEAALEKVSQLPAQDRLPAGPWKPGVNYKPLVPAQPTSTASGKVEVVEVFWYGCSHCYTLEPFIESWAKNKPSYVEFVRVPVIWGPVHKAHAKLYYVIQSLGREKDLHTKVFDTIHRSGNGLVGNDEESTYRVQRDFMVANGVKEADFKSAFDSFGVATSLQRATQLTRNYQVEGTPLMVVNGKYTTDVGMAGGHSKLLELLNSLAAAEKRR